MGKIFYLMGKSAAGKDKLYSMLLNDEALSLKRVMIYTTRPKRSDEEEGREYFFTDEAGYREMLDAGRVIEAREYQTVYGPWIYFTADDGNLKPEEADYLGIGTLESYRKLSKYFGQDKVCPIYIEVEDGERLFRALRRERKMKEPRYEEMCRRFLADQEDFSEEKLREAGIEKRFQNIILEDCFSEIRTMISTISGK